MATRIQGESVMATTKATPTAETAHQMMVAVLVLVITVYIGILVAGVSPRVGKGIAALMLLLLFLQGVTRVNPLMEWILNHPLTPTTVSQPSTSAGKE